MDLPAVYRAATCPLLVVHAVAPSPEPHPSWLLDLTRARELEQSSQDHPLVTVRQVEAGHGLINTHPDLVAELVREHAKP